MIQNPHTKLVLLGQLATFTCKGSGLGVLLINNEPFDHPHSLNNISYGKDTSGGVTTFTVNILATRNNNYTKIGCNFEQYGQIHSTDSAYMIAVPGKKHAHADHSH